MSPDRHDIILCCGELPGAEPIDAIVSLSRTPDATVLTDLTIVSDALSCTLRGVERESLRELGRCLIEWSDEI